jgi:cobalamin-dependent methionine synthase I
LLVSLLLRRRGWNVVYLGANVPSAQFADTVQNLKADLVILVAQQLTTAASLQHTALVLSSKKISVAFGGRIFSIHPELARSILGYFLGHTIREAVEYIEALIERKPRQAAIHATSPEYVAAHQAFVSRRTQIELTFKQLLEPLMIAPENIETGMHFLGDNIAAALQLGDTDYVSTEVDWLRVLLQAYAASPDQLIYFMETYSEAVNRNINGQGKPIFEWLAAEVKKLKA